MTATLDNYKQDAIRRFLGQNPHVTAESLERYYTPDAWRDEWTARIVIPAAERGEKLDAAVLDALERYYRFRIAQQHPEVVPRGYVFPEFR